MTEQFRDNEARNRFELDIEGTFAFITYRKSAGAIALVHTDVPAKLSGRGVGSKLGRATLDAVRARTATLGRMQFHPIVHDEASAIQRSNDARRRNQNRCRYLQRHLMTEHPHMRLVDVYASLAGLCA
jgi:predicted GNAT family acetyltransferase